MSHHVLIVEARFYEDLADALVEGAVAELERRSVTYDRVAVPGVLEIPAAVEFARGKYDGFIALGVVIRGETTHYDIVCNESARALMDLTVKSRLALGNGIQTVENEDQAWARARADKKNKGGGAAAACLEMIGLKEELGVPLR